MCQFLAKGVRVMQIYEYKPSGMPPLGATAVALGFFDGVHLAHRELIERTVKEANLRGLKSTVFTFSSESGTLKSSSPRIYSTEEKLDIISRLGVDTVIIADFNSVSSMTAEQFIADTLVGDLGARLALAGYNFRFGKGASGDAETLKLGMAGLGLEAIILDEYCYSGKSLSSSLVREALAVGDVALAAELLGAPYRLRARVVRGRGEGRKMGIPTVNADIPPGRLLPRLGVYRTVVPIDGKIYTGLTNVGECPTFGARAVHAETYILDYFGDLYGRDVNIYFLGFIRDERTFPNAEELLLQIERDKACAIKKNEGDIIKWTEYGLS